MKRILIPWLDKSYLIKKNMLLFQYVGDANNHSYTIIKQKNPDLNDFLVKYRRGATNYCAELISVLILTYVQTRKQSIQNSAHIKISKETLVIISVKSTLLIGDFKQNYLCIIHLQPNTAKIR